MVKKFNLKPWFAHESGTVLLTTILLISAASAVVLSIMQTSFLYAKISAHFTRNHQDFYQLEVIAHKLIDEVNEQQHAHCLIQQSNPNQALHSIKKKGCVFPFQNQNYLYFISDLGLFPCLLIQNKGNMTGSHHWLISVMNEQRDIIQLRIGKPEMMEPCHQSGKLIPTRITSWRYLGRFNDIDNG